MKNSLRHQLLGAHNIQTMSIVLFQFLNYHIALELNLNYIHNPNEQVIDQQLPKRSSISQ